MQADLEKRDLIAQALNERFGLVDGRYVERHNEPFGGPHIASWRRVSMLPIEDSERYLTRYRIDLRFLMYLALRQGALATSCFVKALCVVWKRY
jgi:hypothetical protein